MPDLESLLWVLPGVLFSFSYSRLRAVETGDYTGWRYVFFIVVVGFITILPVNWLLQKTSKDVSVIILSSLIAFILPFIIKKLFMPFIKKIEEQPNFFIPSNVWSIIYFFFPLEIRDKFIKNCIDYEGEAVLVTVDESILYIKPSCDSKNCCDVKNNMDIRSTIFLGILVEFPYVTTDSIDSHVIRILPLLSGYRYIKKEKIKWIKKYTINENSSGILIPRRKIIHFCIYDEEIHSDLLENSKQSETH